MPQKRNFGTKANAAYSAGIVAPSCGGITASKYPFGNVSRQLMRGRCAFRRTAIHIQTLAAAASIAPETAVARPVAAVAMTVATTAKIKAYSAAAAPDSSLK